jgi:hypothetical protein
MKSTIGLAASYFRFGADAVSQHDLQQVHIGNVLDLSEQPVSAISRRSNFIC